MGRHRLRIIAAVLVAGLASPLAGAADAGSAKGKGKGKAKVSAKAHKGKGRCAAKRYEVHGTLDEGSTLVRVAGTKTKRRSDDRWSGTLIVEIDRGNSRGRAHLGWRSYTVSAVRVTGAGAALPAAGTRLSLRGTQPAAGCKATKAFWDDEEAEEPELADDEAAEDAEAEEAPQPVTGVTIERITFKGAKGRGPGATSPAERGGDDPATDDDGGWTEQNDDDNWGEDDDFFSGRR